MKNITVKGRSFLDRNGKEKVFNGVNIVCKEPRSGYLFDFRKEDWDALEKMKIDLVRFGVIWSGAEPVCGVVDDDYLDRVVVKLKEFEDHGIPVYLDMHQDLYSIRFWDGAPIWATLSRGEHKVDGAWSSAYYISPAVHTALDAFWDNAPARDGRGLQDHFAWAWQKIVERVAENPNVVGYDILNEPSPGTPFGEYFNAFIRSLNLYWDQTTGKKHTFDETFAMYYDPDRIGPILRDITVDEFSALMDGEPAKIVERFETKYLQPFFDRVAASIRKADKEGILLYCNSAITNWGGIDRLRPIEVDGVRDPIQAFAAHGYDLVDGCPYVYAARQDRVDRCFQRHLDWAVKYDVPLLAGEWGAIPPDDPLMAKKMREMRSFFTAHDISQTYWDFSPGTGVLPL
jgi:endoglycosylceramidase